MPEMTRRESAIESGEGGALDYLDEPDDDEPGMTIREAQAMRAVEATKKLRSEVYRGLPNYKDDS